MTTVGRSHALNASAESAAATTTACLMVIPLCVPKSEHRIALPRSEPHCAQRMVRWPTSASDSLVGQRAVGAVRSQHPSFTIESLLPRPAMEREDRGREADELRLAQLAAGPLHPGGNNAPTCRVCDRAAVVAGEDRQVSPTGTPRLVATKRGSQSMVNRGRQDVPRHPLPYVTRPAGASRRFWTACDGRGRRRTRHSCAGSVGTRGQGARGQRHDEQRKTSDEHELHDGGTTASPRATPSDPSKARQ